MRSLIDRPATFATPMEMLVACHGRVKHFSMLALRIAERVQERGAEAEARLAAENVLKYFDISAPLHHADEEEDLFPLLAKAGDASINDAIAFLCADHTVLDASWAELRKHLLAVKEGNAPVFVDLAARLQKAYADHTAREERDVFAHATRLLNAPTLSEMGKRMAARRKA